MTCNQQTQDSSNQGGRDRDHYERSLPYRPKRGEEDDKDDQNHYEHERGEVLESSLLALELSTEGHKIARRERYFIINFLLSFFDKRPYITFHNVTEDNLSPH